MTARRKKKSTHPRYLLQLQDEAPKIGSGFRPVELVTIGPVWVKVKTLNGDDERLNATKKFPRTVWDKLGKTDLDW